MAHHGSGISITDKSLAVTSPELAVISVGEGDLFGHPSSELVSRLEEKVGPENVYRTDEHGTRGFITEGDRIWAQECLP